MAGIGGTQVELLRDVAFELAPMSRAHADTLLDSTGAGELLKAFRGNPPADRDAVIDVILRLAHLAVTYEEIAEIEINPLLVGDERNGVSAVDARVRVGG